MPSNTLSGNKLVNKTDAKWRKKDAYRDTRESKKQVEHGQDQQANIVVATLWFTQNG